MRSKFVRLAKLICQSFKWSTKSQRHWFYSIIIIIIIMKGWEHSHRCYYWRLGWHIQNLSGNKDSRRLELMSGNHRGGFNSLLVTLRMGRKFKRAGETEREKSKWNWHKRGREILLGLIRDKMASFSSTLKVIILLKLYTHTHCLVRYTLKCKIHHQWFWLTSKSHLYLWLLPHRPSATLYLSANGTTMT